MHIEQFFSLKGLLRDLEWVHLLMYFDLYVLSQDDLCRPPFCSPMRANRLGWAKFFTSHLGWMHFACRQTSTPYSLKTCRVNWNFFKLIWHLCIISYLYDYISLILVWFWPLELVILCISLYDLSPNLTTGLTLYNIQ